MPTETLILLLSLTLLLAILGWFITYRKQSLLINSLRKNEVDKLRSHILVDYPEVGEAIQVLYDMAFAYNSLSGIYRWIASKGSAGSIIRFVDSLPDTSLWDTLPDELRVFPLILNDHDYLNMIRLVGSPESEHILGSQREVFDLYVATMELNETLLTMVKRMQSIPEGEIDRDAKSLVEEFKVTFNKLNEIIGLSIAACEKTAQYITLGILKMGRELIGAEE